MKHYNSFSFENISKDRVRATYDPNDKGALAFMSFLNTYMTAKAWQHDKPADETHDNGHVSRYYDKRKVKA